MRPFSTFLARSALTIPACRRSLWVHGHTERDFTAAAQLIASIMADRPHVGLAVTSSRPETLRFLNRTYINDYTLPVPYPAAAGLWLRRLQVRHIMLLGGAKGIPGRALRIAIREQIPVSVINIGHPGALSNSIVAMARRAPAGVRFCVFDEETARQLSGLGIASRSIVETGALSLEPVRNASAKTLRDQFHLLDETPVLAAIDTPREEEGLVLDAFASVRRDRLDARLLFEPRDFGRIVTLQREINARGWRTASPPAAPDPWDVFLPSSAGEASALLPVVWVLLVGGSFSSSASGAIAAAAARAGVRVLVGPNNSFVDVPWRFMEHIDAIARVQSSELGRALAAALDQPDVPSVVSHEPAEATRRTREALACTLPESPALPQGVQDWRIPTWRDRAGSSWLWRQASRLFARRRMDSWDRLREHLGYPRSVLCLGNGPSSEDPRLASFGHDCLIRVNWVWKSRGFLLDPQIVFVGDPNTVNNIDNVVFGIWNTSLEYGMLLRHLTVRGFKAMPYFTMGRLCPLIRDHSWSARPTNGALMIAAAVALNPERLIISGLDLYTHPDGRYPGDLLCANAYARDHDRTTDLEIIWRSLRLYRGEVTILSDALKQALETMSFPANGPGNAHSGPPV